MPGDLEKLVEVGLVVGVFYLYFCVLCVGGFVRCDFNIYFFVEAFRLIGRVAKGFQASRSFGSKGLGFRA